MQMRSQKVSTPDLVLEKIASMSCKAAVEGNDVPTRAEAEALISELLELENPIFLPTWQTNDHFDEQI